MTIVFCGWKWRLVDRRIVVMLRVIFIYRLQQKIVAADTVLMSKSVLYVVTIEGHFTANSAFRKEVLYTLITITPRGTETQSNTASLYRHNISYRLVSNISLSSEIHCGFGMNCYFFSRAKACYFSLPIVRLLSCGMCCDDGGSMLTKKLLAF